MSTSVRCIIIDCQSNARKDLDLKFFKFPSRESRLYGVWVNICYGSINAIRKNLRPYICSKHFHSKYVGCRGLAYNAVPTLNLNNPPFCIIDQKPTESDLTPEQLEKTRMVRLLNDSVVEWAKRSQYYSLMSIPNTELIKVASKFLKILAPKLTLNLDNYWCRKLRARLCQVEPYERTSKWCSMLSFEKIIRELDPTVTIYKNTEAIEKRAELTKLILDNRSCSYAPKIREDLVEKSDVGVVRFEFTTRPILAKEDGAPKFSGKRYVKKTKSHTNTKSTISGSSPFIEFLKKKNVLTSFDGDNSSENSQKSMDSFDLAVNSEINEDLDQRSHSVSPLLVVKNEVMDDQSADCSIILDDIKFCTEFINTEVSNTLVNNDGVSCNACVLDEVSNYNFLKQDKVIQPNIVSEISLPNEVNQSNSSIDTISQQIIKDKSIKRDITQFKRTVFKTPDKVMDLTQSDLNIEEGNPDESLECDITTSSSKISENVFQNKTIGSSGNKVLATNINEGFLENYLSYIRKYEEPKPKLPTSWFPVRSRRVNKRRRRSAKTPKLDNYDNIQSKKQKPKSLSLLTSNNINCKTKINSKEAHPSDSSVVANERVEENNSQLMLNNVNRVNGSQLNIQYEIKLNKSHSYNDPSLGIQPDIENTHQFEIELKGTTPHVDGVVKNNSNEKDAVCFDWSSDDSTSDPKPKSKICTYMKALDYLKPLEDFVLRKEDFRAIGLVSNLEIHFKQRALLRHEKI